MSKIEELKEKARYAILETYEDSNESRIVGSAGCIADAELLIQALNDYHSGRFTYQYVLLDRFDEELDTPFNFEDWNESLDGAVKVM